MGVVQRNSLLGGLVLLFISGVLIYVGVLERNLASRASQVPEEIALKDLIARGPSGNPNILLKDFILGTNYVYSTKNGSWQGAWVPAVPTGSPVPGEGGPGRPSNIRALIFTINAKSEADLYARCNQPRLRALVTNEIVSLGSQEKSLLESSYPGTDFSRCLIIQEGREPAGAVKQILMIGGGILTALIGLGVMGLFAIPWSGGSKAPAKKKRKKRPIEDEDEEEDEAPRKRKKRDREDEDEEDEPPRKRRVRDEDEDEEPPRKRKPRDEDEDEAVPRKRKARDEDIQEEPPRKRRPRDEEDETPRRRKRPSTDDD
jgi:hypothetical protein